jgi:lipopolysaccharide export system protein LptA
VTRAARWLLALVSLVAVEAILPAPTPAQGVNRCPINIRRAGPRVERPDPDREGAIIAYIGGPVTVTCGDATMTGDSAEWRQASEIALMIGSVRYRDTTRTLNSERLTFYGRRDEIVAIQNVELVRLANGARLEGPRVSFTRTPFAGARTVATDRPRMTLPATRSGQGAGPETIVDSDVAEFVGESEASATGNVEMTRGEISATAERARFSEIEARAVMYENAVISGEGFDLSGDSIVAGFELGELRSIHAFEQATASGERFRLEADQIRARLTGDEVDVIWAFGTGRSLASSAQFTLAGDSIEFAFIEGVADSVTAIGAAAAEQTPDTLVAAEQTLDTLVAAEQTPDTLVAAEQTPDTLVAAEQTPDTLVAAEQTPDTLAAAEQTPDTLAAAEQAQDTLAAAEQTPDTLAAAEQTTADSLVRDSTRGPAGRIAEPSLRPDPGASWIAGDTVRAWFESDPAAAQTAGASGSENTGGARIRRLRALGDARSFFAAVRDTLRSSEASRNYLLGSSIQIDFEAGEPKVLSGTDAIGVYLEPVEEGDGG